MSSVRITNCGACGGDLIERLNLGSSPPSCSMRPVDAARGAERHYPLKLVECVECSLVQLSDRVDSREVFHSDYPYSSGNSPALHKNFEELASRVERKPDDLIVDIGANDGTLLSKFEGRRIGVEPTGQIERFKTTDIISINEFFSLGVAQKIVANHGHAKHVTACNVLAHVAHINDTMNGIAHLIGDDGTLVAENHDLCSIGRGAQWDTVYHEHLRYYSPYSFAKLCAAHGLALRDWEQIDTHGGSFRAWVTPGTAALPPKPAFEWEWVRERAAHARAVLRAMLADCRNRHEAVWGISATARASTVIGYCGLTEADLVAVAEVPHSDKLNHYMPGTLIPVQSESMMLERQPEWAVLFSWYMADLIVPKLREAGSETKFIVPLPTPRIM